ncbi:ATP-binding protein [Clostridium boliviensis]|uniref:ATP-binding protein n=2 Tax=Bacillota TaxID=1239 RepID=A0ABU4GLR2_9CLOT|nr:ATP-binding protein [Clostridium boliviensis]MDW2798546.1 ATP-binding protein [Clostridium boliviensis]
MLISFRFKNFRSFLDETFINMRAVTYKELPDHLIPISNQKLIKTLAVYGPNSSGKTNLFLAFASFHSLIFWQLFPSQASYKNRFLNLLQMNSMDKIIPFRQDNPEVSPTEMDISFISNGKIYEYGFSICSQNIISEHLTVDNHLVFSRTASKLAYGRHYEKCMRLKSGIRPHDNRLFCSILSSLNTPEIIAIMKPFENFFSTKIYYYFDDLELFQILGNTLMDGMMFKILENPEAVNFSLCQLRKLGIPVENVIVDKGIPKLGYLTMSRTNKQPYVRYMDLTDISSGTLKNLFMFLRIYELNQNGGILMADSISSEFHPAVTKFIVDSFQQESNKNVQLIFSTHDISILNNQQFRRDEVAFTDINQYGESKLYTLADIKVRSDASFSKDYLLGKYGAIPLVKDTIF